MQESYGKLPLAFEPNLGQADGQAKFFSRGSGYSLFLTSTGAVLNLQPHPGLAPLAEPRKRLPSLPTQSAVVRMELLGSLQAPLVMGVDPLPGRTNYFIGNDPARWKTDVPTFGKVRYLDIYPGVDLAYYGTQGQLEYDFVVRPGGDAGTIALRFEGVESLELNAEGDLVLRIDGRQIRQHKPLVYQELNGTRRIIAGEYVLNGKQEVGFRIAAYDASKPLVIDPVLVYSTYLGGNDFEYGFGIAVDAAGNAYVTGVTASTDFPSAVPKQRAAGDTYDAFVAKFNPSGSTLLYSTYLGGDSLDQGFGIALDSQGNAYIAGMTGSGNFPTRAALQPAFGGVFDTFVVKLDPSGALVYSTYLGGNDDDEGLGIAVDASGSAYVAGYTGSINFPTQAAQQPAFGGVYDGFVAKLNPAGSALVYSTYLGGNDDDEGFGIAADASGSAYVAGYTASGNFPTVAALQPAFGGIHDAFVAKLNPAGSALVYSTYLGGNDDDAGFGIAVDASGSAYVTGLTASGNFPTVAALQPAFGGVHDGFVAKLNPAGSALVYSTYLGGNDDDAGFGIAVDASGSAYVTGFTASGNFPTVAALQPAFGGGVFDAFVAKLSPAGSALTYATYLGGADQDIGYGIAVDAAGRAHVTGYTASSNFPTVSPIQPAFMGVLDAFVAKLNPGGSGLLFATYLGGSGDDEGLAIAVDGNGDIYLAGFATSYNFPTALPLQPAINLGGDAFVARITEAVVVGNHPPVADAGPDQSVECNSPAGTTVFLNGSASSDPDGDSLTYTWAGPFGTATGPTPVVTLPVGTHSITLTVTDGHGGMASDSLVVQVVDTTPPIIKSLAANPNVLWPPNHKMIPVTVRVAAEDRCSRSVSCKIIAVSSNEPVNGLGDGDQAPDWQITGPLTVNLRAERSGKGNGRVYTITVQCADPSGNQVTKTVTVRVPHDQGDDGKEKK